MDKFRFSTSPFGLWHRNSSGVEDNVTVPAVVVVGVVAALFCCCLGIWF